MWLVSDTMTSLEKGERSMVKMQSQIVFLKKFGTNGGNIGIAKSSRPYPRRRPKISDQRKQVKDQDLQNIWWLQIDHPTFYRFGKSLFPI